MKNNMTSFSAAFRWLSNQVEKAIARLIEGFWWPPLALLAVVIYWFSVASGIPTPTEQTVEKYGVYGDSFGQITSLFTALGFGGLVITLLLQQRQIRSQERTAEQNRQKDEKERYEAVLFRLLDTYRQTLSEVSVGEVTSRAVIRKALDRVDAGVVEEGVNGLPRDLRAKWDSGTLQEKDRERIDYLHFRNFKIVATELQLQTRLVDTFEVLLEHMFRGAPDHLLIEVYRDLVFAQITFFECRYFFLAALSHPSRVRLRNLIAGTGFLDRVSRSQIHQLHRDMYKEYWGYTLERRELPATIPMAPGRIKRAMRAHKAAGGAAKTTYTPLGTRRPKDVAKMNTKDSPQ